MSYRLVDRIIKSVALPHRDKAVLIILASFAQDDGTRVFPSIATVAKEAGCDERTVQRAIRSLEALGLLYRLTFESIGRSKRQEWVITLGNAPLLPNPMRFDDCPTDDELDPDLYQREGAPARSALAIPRVDVASVEPRLLSHETPHAYATAVSIADELARERRESGDTLSEVVTTSHPLTQNGDNESRKGCPVDTQISKRIRQDSSSKPSESVSHPHEFASSLSDSLREPSEADRLAQYWEGRIGKRPTIQARAQIDAQLRNDVPFEVLVRALENAGPSLTAEWKSVDRHVRAEKYRAEASKS